MRKTSKAPKKGKKITYNVLKTLFFVFIQKKWQKHLVVTKKHRTFALAIEKHRGVEQLVARQAHNLEVARSNPASATKVSVTSYKVTRYADFSF